MGGQVIQAIAKCAKHEVDLFELNEEESMDDEVETFELIDTIQNMIEKLRETVKCSITSVQAIIGDGELKNVFLKFRFDVESLLKNDVNQCLKSDGILGKLK